MARDGYTLHKVFNTFDNSQIHSSYIYALRFLNNICCLDYQPTSLSQMKTILDYFSSKSVPFKNSARSVPCTKKQLHQFIQNQLPVLTPLAQQELKQYRTYLAAFYKPSQKIGVIDSVTSFFSSQKLVERAIPTNEIVGYYWAVNPSAQAARHRFVSFLLQPTGVNNYTVFTHCWPFMEFLFTAPEPPIKNISPQGTAIYDTVIPPQERDRISAYKPTSLGMIQFAQDVKSIFGGHDLFLTSNFLIQWVNWFLLHPTREDKQQMATIFHASGSDHKEYEPLLSFRPSLWQIVRNFKQYITFAKQVYWKTPFQFFLTCCLSPAAIERTSNRERILYFFPRLRRQYARKKFSLGSTNWTLIWGRRRD